MKNKELTLDVLFFLIPIVGLFFLWQWRNSMKPVYFYLYLALGLICLAVMVLEIYKVAYL
jgi:predicted membrane channel-forming protein YqfA (hemolysin III family)